MFAVIHLIAAATFCAGAVMMFVLMHTLFKQLPHAEHISTMYMLCYGAMTVSALLQFFGMLVGSSLLLSLVLLILSSFGFALALITPIATTVWLLHGKNTSMEQDHHARVLGR